MGKEEVSMPVLLGEVRTALLRNSVAIDLGRASQLVRLAPDQPVGQWERPISLAVSPRTLIPINCLLPSTDGKRVQVVGTVSVHTRVVGGRLVQAIAAVRVERATGSKRLPWQHHRERPGVVEAAHSFSPADVTAGMFAFHEGTTSLDLSSICSRLLDTLQGSRILDGKKAFTAPHTRLRWAKQAVDGPSHISFTIRDEESRTADLRLPDGEDIEIIDFCSDLARHDWLLTRVRSLIRKAGIGDKPRGDVVHDLTPAVDHLLPLWLPGMRLVDRVMPLWNELEKRAHLSEEWAAASRQIRDQIALAAAESAKACSEPT